MKLNNSMPQMKFTEIKEVVLILESILYYQINTIAKFDHGFLTLLDGISISIKLFS